MRSVLFLEDTRQGACSSAFLGVWPCGRHNFLVHQYGAEGEKEIKFGLFTVFTL